MVKTQNRPMYHLIDSRGGTGAANLHTDDLNLVDDDWERFILLSSNSEKEVCHHANIGDYGDNCVVAKDDRICWGWYDENGRWDCKRIMSL
jgi:hypothetical protein